MSQDDRLRTTPDTNWRSPGIGHASGWQRGSCAKKLFTMAGRKLRRVGGVKTWVCACCAKD